MSAKFRKKPIVIEAMPYDGTFLGGKAVLDWADETVYRGDLLTLKVKTLEGELTISPGDWIIKGVAGEFYPCRDDIFEATYEPVE